MFCGASCFSEILIPAESPTEHIMRHNCVWLAGSKWCLLRHPLLDQDHIVDVSGEPSQLTMTVEQIRIPITLSMVPKSGRPWLFVVAECLNLDWGFDNPAGRHADINAPQLSPCKYTHFHNRQALVGLL